MTRALGRWSELAHSHSVQSVLHLFCDPAPQVSTRRVAALQNLPEAKYRVDAATFELLDTQFQLPKKWRIRL